MVLFLDVLVVLSPWRHSIVQLRRSVTELRGLDGTIFGSIIVWQRFFLPRAEIALREYTGNFGSYDQKLEYKCRAAKVAIFWIVTS